MFTLPVALQIRVSLPGLEANINAGLGTQFTSAKNGLDPWALNIVAKEIAQKLEKLLRQEQVGLIIGVGCQASALAILTALRLQTTGLCSYPCECGFIEINENGTPGKVQPLLWRREGIVLVFDHISTATLREAVANKIRSEGGIVTAIVS